MMEQEIHSFGALFSPKDIRDYKLCTSAIQLPNIPDKYIVNLPKIKNQGQHQTCVAYSLSSLVEFYNLRDTLSYRNFSTDFIYGCRTDDDYLGEGMYLRDGLKVLQKYGDVFYSTLPGNTDVPTARSKVFKDFENLIKEAEPNRISAYYKIQSLDELKYSIYTSGPVSAAMRWYKNAKLDSQNIYRFNPNDNYSGHAILIVGWDDQNLIVQNSWGKYFGDSGLFYVPIDNFKEVFVELYGVTDNISNIKKPTKIIDILGPSLNLLINFILKLIDKGKK